MLNRLRNPVLTRIAAPLLLLGLALAWAAPARAARAWEAERTRVSELLAAHDAARVDAALEAASRIAASPEAFAAEVVRALDGQRVERLSPAADALLRALFGRMLQAMTLGGGAPSFVAPSTSDGTHVPLSDAAEAYGSDVEFPAAAEVAAPARPAHLVVPREARPQVQTLGP